MTPNETARYALEALLKNGADRASCRASSGRTDEFNVEANKFTLMRTLFHDELTIKAIKGNRKGIMMINRLDADSVKQAVADCVTLASSATPDEAEDIAEKCENKNFDRNLGGADREKLFDRTRDFIGQVRDEFPKIVLEGMTSEFNSIKTAYMNSNGVEFNSESEYYRIETMFSAKDGEKSSSFNGYGASLVSLEKPFMNLDMHRTLIAESEKSLDTRMVEGKFTGKVIVTPACDDMIWRTLIGCFLSDTSMVQGTSRWKDSLGAKVADPKLTFRAAPLHPLMVNGERFTVDGYESRDMDIIKDGVLVSFALSLYGSRKTGKKRALNSAFGNIEVAAGNTPLDKMIGSVDRGILLNRFSGGMPGPGGDISGVAKNSFLIENGAITGALKETMVSFNIAEAMKNITAISAERCSNGVSILPWCCFDGITLSGGNPR